MATPRTDEHDEREACSGSGRSFWLMYVLAVLAPPLAVCVVTRSVMRAALCVVLYMVTFGIGGLIMAVVDIRRGSPRWTWSRAPLVERGVVLVGIALALSVYVIVAVFISDRPGTGR